MTLLEQAQQIRDEQRAAANTATRVGTCLVDIIGNVADLPTTDYVKTQLGYETEARKKGDTNLQAYINNLEARIDTSIAQESSAREKGETALEEADVRLQTNIDNEQSARTSGEKTLQTQINTLTETLGGAIYTGTLGGLSVTFFTARHIIDLGTVTNSSVAENFAALNEVAGNTAVRFIIYTMTNGNGGLIQQSFDKSQSKCTQILTLGQSTFERRITGVGTTEGGKGTVAAWELTRPHAIKTTYTAASRTLSTVLYDYHGAATKSVFANSAVLPLASDSAAGLMSADNFSRFAIVGTPTEIPAAVFALRPKSTGDEVKSAFGISTTSGSYSDCVSYLMGIIEKAQKGARFFTTDTDTDGKYTLLFQVYISEYYMDKTNNKASVCLTRFLPEDGTRLSVFIKLESFDVYDITVI